MKNKLKNTNLSNTNLSNTPYGQLKDNVLNRMTAYQTDFTTHDRKIIDNHDCDPFILLVRDWGTNIISLSDYINAQDIISNDPLGYSKYLFGQVQNCRLPEKFRDDHIMTINYYNKEYPGYDLYLFDGLQCRSIDDSEAINTIYRFYRKTTLKGA